MRLIGIFLSACVVLAAMKAAIVALLLLFTMSLIWGFYLHPRETFGFLAYCAILSIACAHPAAAVATIGLALVCAQLMTNCDQPP